MEFAMLPPEVNSGRMYAGPGSGPMLAAATSWHGLASELESAATSYKSVISRLGSGWLGPASTAMAAAATPYATWMHTTATQAAHVAAQAQAAAAAYETAFAMTVPPPTIAANRALLTSLVTTNLFGQNTPAIAATELHYGEMWAQDATAMYGYAGSSQAASTLTPFTPPPQNTNPAGSTNQAAAVAQSTAASAGTNAQTTASSLTALQGLTSGASQALPGMDPALSAAYAALGTELVSAFVVDSMGTFGIDGLGTFLIDPLGLVEIGEVLPAIASPGFFASAAAPVSASMGQAASLARLSVPQAWTAAAPAFHSVATALPATSVSAAPAAVTGAAGSTFSEMALAGAAGRALAGTAGLRRRNQPGGTTTRKRREPAQSSPTGPITGISAELRKLAKQRDGGILTDEEFTEEKRRLLGSPE